MTRTKVPIRKRPKPQTSPDPAQVAVLGIQIAALEAMLRKHNADLVAHTRAIEAAVEPIQKALEATAGKTVAPGQLDLAPTKRRSRKQKE